MRSPVQTNASGIFWTKGPVDTHTHTIGFFAFRRIQTHFFAPELVDMVQRVYTTVCLHCTWSNCRRPVINLSTLPAEDVVKDDSMIIAVLGISRSCALFPTAQLHSVNFNLNTSRMSTSYNDYVDS